MILTKKIFEGYGGHLGHVTSIMSLNLNFLVPKSLHKKLVQNGPLVSEKKPVLIFICK